MEKLTFQQRQRHKEEIARATLDKLMENPERGLEEISIMLNREGFRSTTGEELNRIHLTSALKAAGYTLRRTEKAIRTGLKFVSTKMLRNREIPRPYRKRNNSDETTPVRRGRPRLEQVLRTPVQQELRSITRSETIPNRDNASDIDALLFSIVDSSVSSGRKVKLIRAVYTD